MPFEACGSLRHSAFLGLQRAASRRSKGARQLCYPPLGGITAALPQRGETAATNTAAEPWRIPRRNGKETDDGNPKNPR